MASLVRSNTDFAAGNLALLGHTLNVRESGLVTVTMSLACLGTESVMRRNLALFTRDSVPPVALPANVKAVPLLNDGIFLADFQTNYENGICYIDTNYVGISAGGRFEYGEQSNTKSFSGYYFADLSLSGTTILTYHNWSFDFTSVSTTISHCSFDPKSRRNPKGRIEDRFNERGGLPINSTIGTYKPSSKGQLRIKQVMSIQIVKNGPVYVITETANPEYDQDTLEIIFSGNQYGS